jgi:hypothetical protein
LEGENWRVSAMLNFAEYHDWIICVQKFAKKWFFACMPASFLQISGTYGTSHAGTIYLLGMGWDITSFGSMHVTSLENT